MGSGLGVENNHSTEVTNRDNENIPSLQHQLPDGSRLLELYNASKRKTKKKKSKADRDREEGMTQCILYIMACLVCYIFPLLYHGLNPNGSETSKGMILYLLDRIFLPLEGFFNFFIFMRPRVNKIKRRKPYITTFTALKMAIQSKGEIRRLVKRQSLKKVARKNSVIRHLNTTTDMNQLIELTDTKEDEKDNRLLVIQDDDKGEEDAQHDIQDDLCSSSDLNVNEDSLKIENEYDIEHGGSNIVQCILK